jgi:acetyl-CoA acetyltransferase
VPLAIKWTGLRVVDTDLFELNEALAAQSQAVRKDLSVEQDRVDISLSAARDIRS